MMFYVFVLIIYNLATESAFIDAVKLDEPLDENKT
jgi:hypothetical protein